LLVTDTLKPQYQPVGKVLTETFGS